MNAPPTAPPSPADARAPAWTLRRSADDRLVLGLCGGLGRATGTSPTALRLAALLLWVVLTPVAVIAYLVTAVILPRDDGTTLIGPGPRERRDAVTAVLCTLIAVPVALGAASVSLLGTGGALPVLFTAAALLGAASLLRRRRGEPITIPHAPAATGPSTPVHPPAMPRDAAAALRSDPFSGTVTGPYADLDADTRVSADELPTEVGGSREHADDGSPPTTDRADTPTFVRPGAGAPPPVPPAPPTRHDGPGAPPPPRRRGLGLPVLAVITLIPAVFVVLVTAGLVDGDYGAWAVMFALMAVVAAGGAVAIAVLRPSYLGAGLLVVLAALIGAVAIGINQAGPVLEDGVGERSFRPTAADELRSPYVLGAGELTLDLRELTLARNSRTRVAARLGFGSLRVIVPRGVRVTTTAGSDLSTMGASARRTGAAANRVAGAPVIELDVDVRAAEVQLLAGRATLIENLEVLATESTGFWVEGGGNSRDGRPSDAGPAGDPTP